MKLLRELFASESGATLVEYSLLVGLIVVAVFSMVVNFGNAAAAMYAKVAPALQNA